MRQVRPSWLFSSGLIAGYMLANLSSISHGASAAEKIEIHPLAPAEIETNVASLIATLSLKRSVGAKHSEALSRGRKTIPA